MLLTKSQTFQIALNEANSCELRLNPWDERAFGFKVSEIFNLDYQQNAILYAIDTKNVEVGVRICCVRHPTGDLRVKRDLIRQGFYLAETSIEVWAPLKALKTKSYFTFQQASKEHLAELQELAKESFKFGRFHEDPFISPEIATKRYEYWVADLVNASNCWIALNETGECIGFFSFGVKDDKVNLVLAGIHPKFSGMGHYFFSSMMSHIAPLGKAVTALISAANIDVINIYSKLGFSFRKPLTGYHKLYREN